MFSAPHQPSQVIQFRSHHRRRPPQALAIPADSLIPARGAVVSALLGAAIWAAAIGLVLRFVG